MRNKHFRCSSSSSERCTKERHRFPVRIPKEHTYLNKNLNNKMLECKFFEINHLNWIVLPLLQTNVGRRKEHFNCRRLLINSTQHRKQQNIHYYYCIIYSAYSAERSKNEKCSSSYGISWMKSLNTRKDCGIRITRDCEIRITRKSENSLIASIK